MKLRSIPSRFPEKNMWDKGRRQRRCVTEYLNHEPSLLPYITTGTDRRNRPIWANEEFAPPCAYARLGTYCPRTKGFINQAGQKLNEAARAWLLQCSHCRNCLRRDITQLLVQACTRAKLDKPLAINKLGELSLDLPAPG